MDPVLDQNLKKIVKNPTQFAETASIEALVNILKQLSSYYYNTGESLVDDIIYDIMRDILEKRDPNNPFLQQVGAPVIKGEVKLPFPMSSLNKIKPGSSNLVEWKNKHSGPYVISDKLDGVSGLLYKENNKFKLYTRGDATTGQNITHLIQYLLKGKYSPTKIPNGTAIRGEIVMNKKNFQTISKEYKNARNTVSGLVNAKHFSTNIAKLTDFIGYAIINPKYKQIEQMDKLLEWGFPTVTYKIVNNINEDLLSSYLEERKMASNYEIDGLVVIDSSSIYDVSEKNPTYGFAFKMMFKDQIAEAEVIDIVWNISKHGTLKPVVIIKPVNLVGVTIKNITAFNARYVVDNNLGPGSIIKIIRSGDVIPHILEVVKGTGAKMPDMPYGWNKTNIDIYVLDMYGEAKNNIIIKQITNFFKVLGVKYISEGVVTNLVSKGYTSIKSILTADKKKLIQIEGIGEKLVDKIFNNIKETFSKIDLQTLMASSNLFGFGMGVRKLKIIVDAYPNIMNEKWDKNELMNKVLVLHGFDIITATHFVDGFGPFKQFFADLEAIDWIDIKRLKEPIKHKAQGNLFKNQKVVFTGFRDEKLEKLVLDNSGEISGSVSKNTTILVHKEGDTTSSKYNKAQELNITTMTKEEFIKKYIK